MDAPQITTALPTPPEDLLGPCVIITGAVRDIHSLLFGSPPSPQERARRDLRRALSARRKLRGIAAAFPATRHHTERAIAQQERAIHALIARLRDRAVEEIAA